LTDSSVVKLQLIVFTLVCASFANTYITQPVLPILQNEFSTDLIVASFSVSAVILGIALSTLPFGILIDKYPIHPIILTGGLVVSSMGFICSITDNIWVLIGARFVQGLFIPALTSCLVSYLAKVLPASSITIVMGSYVSATVLGGMGGRLLGGWIHPPLHWRYAFVSASIFILVATLIAFKGLPRYAYQHKDRKTVTFKSLLKQKDLLLIFFCAAASFAVFSSIFNFLPYRLKDTPFNLSTEMITLVYLVYIMGIFMGTTAGRLAAKIGTGNTMLIGSMIFFIALSVLLIPSIYAVIIGLVGVCAGFFTIHAVAIGILNSKLTHGQGKANALYVLFYYIGGWLGITLSGIVYKNEGWTVMIITIMSLLVIPVATGLKRKR
jgi:YNFM family putative membrane transporter